MTGIGNWAPDEAPDPLRPAESTRTSIEVSAGSAGVLVGSNVVCALLGIVQSVVVARAVGPSGLGVIGVLLALNGAVANLLDLRIFDVAAAVYFEDHGSVTMDHRTSAAQLCILANTVLGAAMVVLGSIVAIVAAHYFINQHVSVAWMVIAAASVGSNFVGGTLFGIQRLTGRFAQLAVWRVVSQVLAVGVSLPIILATRSLTGYFVALAVSSGLALVVNIIATVYLWARAMPSRLYRVSGWLVAWPSLRSRGRAVLGANVYAYSKLIHRSGDVLIVAAVAGDSATGIYRLARSLTDYMYILFESMNQVYFPRFLDQLNWADTSDFWRSARRLAIFAIAATVTSVGLGLVVLRPIVNVVLTPEYETAVPAIIVLIVPLAFVLGVHMWLWPLTLHRDEVTRFGLWAMVAAGGQVAVTVILAHVNGASGLDGAYGYVTYYVWLYVPLMTVLRRRHAGDRARR